MIEIQELCTKNDELQQHQTELGNTIENLCTAIRVQGQRTDDKLDQIMAAIQSSRSTN